MHKLILLLGVLACLMAVQARHYDRSAEESSDGLESLRPTDRLSRHRRRRWQSNGYDYSPPNYYYPERRNDRDQEVLQNIYRLLEDISAYIRRPPPPPPPPQPIYIPYPVSFPTRVNCRVPKPQNTTGHNPDTGPRNNFYPGNNQTPRPVMEDTNQNWGFYIPEEDYQDESDGARPISFEPLVPKQLLKRPAPEVEHGSQQVFQTTQAPRFADVQQAQPVGLSLSSSSASASVVPGMCNAAILSCCGFSGNTSQQRQCFTNVGCVSSYGEGRVCSTESIQKALESFRLAYAPTQ